MIQLNMINRAFHSSVIFRQSKPYCAACCEVFHDLLAASSYGTADIHHNDHVLSALMFQLLLITHNFYNSTLLTGHEVYSDPVMRSILTLSWGLFWPCHEVYSDPVMRSILTLSWGLFWPCHEVYSAPVMRSILTLSRGLFWPCHEVYSDLVVRLCL